MIKVASFKWAELSQLEPSWAKSVWALKKLDEFLQKQQQQRDVNDKELCLF